MFKSWPQVRESEVGMEPRLEGPLHKQAPFRLENPALQEFVMHIYQQGADPVRLARLMFIIHGDQYVQSHLYQKIRSGYGSLTTVEDLEAEIDRILMYVSGTIESDWIGLFDLAPTPKILINASEKAAEKTILIGSKVAGKAARMASRTAGAVRAEVQIALGGANALSPGWSDLTAVWGRRLLYRVRWMKIPVDRYYLLMRMERYNRYQGKFARLRGIAGRRKVFRGVPKKSKFLFDDAHALSVKDRDQRWHLPGERTVYFGTTKSGTIAELEKNYGSKWMRKRSVKETTVWYENALDLTDPFVLQELGVDEAMLYGVDKSHGQVISSIARELGFDAILSKSAATSSAELNVTILRSEEFGVRWENVRRTGPSAIPGVKPSDGVGIGSKPILP